MTKRLRRLDDAGPFIRERQEFTSGLRKTPYGNFVSMSASVHDTGPRLHGMWSYLPREYHDSVGHATYVVFSYETPMAWWLESPEPGASTDVVERWLADGQVGFWVMPSVKYSVTTTQHQSIIANAVDPGTTREFVPYTIDGYVDIFGERGYWRASGFTTEFRQCGWDFKHVYKNRGEHADGPSVERTYY